MKILVVGHSGQVAHALAARSTPETQVRAIGRPELDLANTTTIVRALDAHAPNIVINAAAYTAVDQAEREEATAFQINADGPGVLARACAERALPLIHFSTDYVFSGDKTGPYDESDATGPSGAYGRGKLAGEAAIAKATPAHVILRTSWVFAAEGKNFVRTMLRLAKTQASVRVVADQNGNPTFAGHVAEGALLVARAFLERRQSEVGVFHMSASGACSWADFAEAIFQGASVRDGPSAVVERITSADYPTPARRPLNSTLNCERLERSYGVRLPHWRVGLDACLDELAARDWHLD